MSLAEFGFAAGEGDVDVEPVDFGDAEGGADGIEAELGAENLYELFLRQAVDFDVEVFGGGAEEGVTDAAADEVRLSAVVMEELDNAEDGRKERGLPQGGGDGFGVSHGCGVEKDGTIPII